MEMKCDYCENDAEYKDGIYGPAHVRCCGDCQDQAAWTLWEVSREAVEE
jgi:hypothetical protein